MNVRELIETLQQFDPEMEVCVAQPTGNYWGQVVARSVYDGDVGISNVEYSEYNRGNIVVDDSDNESETKEVVVIG